MEIAAVALGVVLVAVGIVLIARSAKPSRRRDVTAGELAERQAERVRRRRARRP